MHRRGEHEHNGQEADEEDNIKEVIRVLVLDVCVREQVGAEREEPVKRPAEPPQDVGERRKLWHPAEKVGDEDVDLKGGQGEAEGGQHEGEVGVQQQHVKEHADHRADEGLKDDAQPR